MSGAGIATAAASALEMLGPGPKVASAQEATPLPPDDPGFRVQQYETKDANGQVVNRLYYALPLWGQLPEDRIISAESIAREMINTDLYLELHPEDHDNPGNLQMDVENQRRAAVAAMITLNAPSESRPQSIFEEKVDPKTGQPVHVIARNQFVLLPPQSLPDKYLAFKNRKPEAPDNLLDKAKKVAPVVGAVAGGAAVLGGAAYLASRLGGGASEQQASRPKSRPTQAESSSGTPSVAFPDETGSTTGTGRVIESQYLDNQARPKQIEAGPISAIAGRQLVKDIAEFAGDLAERELAAASHVSPHAEITVTRDYIAVGFKLNDISPDPAEALRIINANTPDIRLALEQAHDAGAPPPVTSPPQVSPDGQSVLFFLMNPVEKK